MLLDPNGGRIATGGAAIMGLVLVGTPLAAALLASGCGSPTHVAADYGIAISVTETAACGCACETPVSGGGCSDVCSDRNEGGDAGANFCEGAGQTPACTKCLEMKCPEAVTTFCMGM